MRALVPVASCLVFACAACTVTASPAADAGPDAAVSPPPTDASATDAAIPGDAAPDAPAPRQAYPLATPDELCDGVAGLNGSAVLSAMKAEYTALFTPRTGTPSPLTIKLKYEGGAILCHPAFVPGPGMGAPSMPAWIEITVALDFGTADGVFAEKRKAQVARRFGDTLELSTTVPMGEVQGSFKALDMPGFDVLSVGIGGTLKTDASTTGNVQQFGAKSAPPPPGQVNPGLTQPIGSWK